jgi:hypothetical protein
MKESEGRAGSEWVEKSWSGSLPVEENNETRLGWVDVANIESLMVARDQPVS